MLVELVRPLDVHQVANTMASRAVAKPRIAPALAVARLVGDRGPVMPTPATVAPQHAESLGSTTSRPDRARTP